ncbi:MAG: hypothetical protein JJT94_12210, partial [Bernardetiaceae bacterium]|nr:hypothetical protein [Bernardetiaceae bacterium]
VTEFNNLIKNVSVNIFEIETEIKKSEIDAEIKNLKTQNEDKGIELSRFIEQEENKLSEKEKNRAENLKTFLAKHDKKESELASFKAELIQKAGKKNKKKNPGEEEKSGETLKQLQDIEGFNFRNKFEDEKKKFQREIREIEQKIERKEKEKSKIGNEQEQQISSLNSILSEKEDKSKNKKTEFSISENLLRLPKIGELHEQGNQKYLAIEFWEDYEIGKQEIELFNAKLCAKP